MTQAADILAHLRTGAELTPLEALERYKTFRLAARIDELRHAGHPIQSRIVTNGRKRYAAYRLIRPVQADLFEQRAGM